MSINGTSRELSAGESGNSAVRDIPTPPARPSWATKSEFDEQCNGAWTVEFSTFIGETGLELAEMCEYAQGTGWTVYAALGALMPQIMEIDTPEALRVYAAEIAQCAAILAKHTRPVGDPA
ncbi:hypothetical protein [Oerskovia rustica]|uniref:Uncharacterized protein n=1 Tax=Oerskovia rustica TaxID=2762237 RepID=A0ABR8RX56_9CELL|nr:hypothetical protein [Oerskovia rustica]MBD7952380.1 hypothetical protein [Oerskovia rustica]